MNAAAEPLSNRSRLIDSLCDRFEAEWRSGQRPQLQAYLANVPAEDQATLLAELLPLECEYRMDQGEAPSREDYAAEFPSFASAVDSVFRQRDRETLSAGATKIIGRPFTAEPSLLGSFGNYELLDEIARGGMGAVYKARQKGLDRLVAVKVILQGPRATPKYVERFQAEARTAARLTHPGIVSIVEVGRHEGIHFFSMELLRGETLAEVIRRGQLSAEQAVQYVRAIAEAVRYAHEHQVLHRDLKPSNVMIDPQGGIKVMDFGLAKSLEDTSSLTQFGEVLGTPSYISPEQARGDWAAVNQATDIYSLGALFYEMLAGRPPFEGGSPMATMLKVVQEEPRPLRELNPTVDPRLESVVMRCLQKQPQARFASAADFIAALDRYTAEPAVQPEKRSLWYRKPKVLAGLAGTVALAALGVILIIRGGDGKEKLRANLAPGDKVEIRDDAPETKTPEVSPSTQAQLAPDGQREFKPREPLNALALVREPAELKDVRSWSLETPGHRGQIQALSFSHDGRRAATGAVDGTLRLWETSTGKLQRIIALEDRVLACSFSPSGRWLAVSLPGKMTLWDANSGKRLKSINTEREQVGQIAWSPDERLLAYGIANFGLQLFDVAAGKPTDVLPIHQPIRAIAFNPQSTQVAAGGDVYDLQSGRRRKRLVPKPETITQVDWSVNDRLVTLGEKVTVWNPETGAKTTEMSADGLKAPIAAVRLMERGRQVLLMTAEGVAETRDVQSGDLIRSFVRPELPEGPGIVTITADGSQFGLGRRDGGVSFVEVKTGKHRTQAGYGILYPDSTWNSPMPAIVWHPQKPLVAYATPRGFSGPGFWDLAGGSPVRYGTGDSHVMIVSAAWSHDGKLLATGGSDPRSIVWDEAGKFQRQLTPGGWNVAMAFSPKSDTLAIAGRGGDLELWDAIKGEMKSTKKLHEGMIGGIAWSPDGKLIATAAYDGHFRITNAESGESITDRKADEKENPLGELHSCDWSSDNKWIAVGGLRKVLVWDVESKKIVTTIATDGWVHRTVFSHDGGRLAYNNGNRVEIVSVPDGKTVSQTPRGAADVRGISWSPNDQSLVIASDNNLDPARIVDPQTGAVRLYLHPQSASAGIITTPAGEFRATAELNDALIVVVQTAAEQENLSVDAFKKRFGFENAVEKATLR